MIRLVQEPAALSECSLSLRSRLGPGEGLSFTDCQSSYWCLCMSPCRGQQVAAGIVLLCCVYVPFL